MAAARQKEINVSMAVVATMTRGTVMMREGSGLLFAGMDAIRKSTYYIKILSWHVYPALSIEVTIRYLNCEDQSEEVPNSRAGVIR